MTNYICDLLSLDGNNPLLLDKVYQVNSDAVITSPLIWAGGGFVIDSGKRLGLQGGLIAPDVPIFSYADRSSRAHVRNEKVLAGWWGLNALLNSGIPVKNDNNIPLQYALDSVAGSCFDPAYPYNWEGGEIVLPQGYITMTGGVVNHGFTTLRGSGRGTIFQPDTVDWTNVDNFMFRLYRQNSAGVPASQFNARLENFRIAGRGFSGVEHQVLAQSAQEQCGCYNVHFDSVYKYGLTYRNGYGGAAMMEIDQCELWLDAAAHSNARLVNIDMNGAYSVGWLTFIISGTTVAGFRATGTPHTEQVGIYSNGRVMVKVKDCVHSEGLQYPILLSGDSCLEGGDIHGGPGDDAVISVDAWNKGGGFIDVTVKRGNAAKLFKDWGTGQSIVNDVTRSRLQV